MDYRGAEPGCLLQILSPSPRSARRCVGFVPQPPLAKRSGPWASGFSAASLPQIAPKHPYFLALFLQTVPSCPCRDF